MEIGLNFPFSLFAGCGIGLRLVRLALSIFSGRPYLANGSREFIIHGIGHATTQATRSIFDRYRDKLINEREAIHRGMGEGGTHHHYFSILPKYSYYSLSLLNKHANEILSCLLTAGEP